jgi:hypothetical protein
MADFVNQNNELVFSALDVGCDVGRFCPITSIAGSGSTNCLAPMSAHVFVAQLSSKEPLISTFDPVSLIACPALVMSGLPPVAIVARTTQIGGFVHGSRQRNSFKRAVSRWRVIGRYLFDKSKLASLGQLNMCGTVFPLGRHIRPFWEDIVMKSSLSFVVPSAIAILSTTLLSGTAASQTATDAATLLPTITIEAPKHVARPRQAARPAQGATGATVASRPTAATHQAPPAAQGSVLAKIAALEKASSSCNGGCETSFRSGNEPWVGCSEAGGLFHTFSATCRDTLTYKTYVECKETKVFLGLDRNKAWWLCTSLLAGGKLAGELAGQKYKVAELKRSRGPR